MEGQETGAGGEKTGQDPPCCYRHPSTAAAAMCVSCGKPVCQECSRRAGYKHYCPECMQAYPVPPPYPMPFPAPYMLPEPQDERERRWWRADWGLVEVLVSLLIIFVLYNALSLILILFSERGIFGGNPLFYSYLAYALFFCPLIVLSTLIIVRRHQRGWKELGIQLGKPGRTVLYGGTGSLVALACSYGVLLLIFLFFYLVAGRTPVSTETEHLQEMGGAAIALILLVTVVLAPIFEELFFRGLLYPALRRRLGVKLAIILDGFIFGALHFQPLSMISLILVGIILAYMYEKTDSLFAPMLTHALYNGVVVAITLLIG